MKMKINRHSIDIIPECEADEAYLEEVLGMKAHDAKALAHRVNAIGLSAWAYLRLEKHER